jgi:hypothetical protein
LDNQCLKDGQLVLQLFWLHHTNPSTKRPTSLLSTSTIGAQACLGGSVCKPPSLIGALSCGAASFALTCSSLAEKQTSLYSTTSSHLELMSFLLDDARHTFVTTLCVHSYYY